MATREQSVFKCASALFKPPSPSLLALQQDTLDVYFSCLPTFKEMLAQLNERGMFLDKEPVDYNIQDFLIANADLSKSSLHRSPVQLLAEPLASAATSIKALTECECIPDPLLVLSDDIECYIALIGDVLNNQLAQKPYEKLGDLEYVTEQEHALQAGKIGYILNMPLGDILALLLHDIARPSIDDPEHGHSNHSQEGSIIGLPLRLPIDYSGYHTFAKYLLYTFCPAYKDLISSTSKRTLAIQTKDLMSQLGGLNDLLPSQLAFALYKIMFMRLIDDMSKVPTSELNKYLDGGAPEYFDHQIIQNMLRKQMSTHLHQIVTQSTDLPQVINDTKKQLDAALLLLLRAKDYSNDPHLYVKFHRVLQPLVEGASLGGPDLLTFG